MKSSATIAQGEECGEVQLVIVVDDLIATVATVVDDLAVAVVILVYVCCYCCYCL